MLLTILITSVSTAPEASPWILVAEIVMAVIAFCTFAYTIWQSRQNKKAKEQQDIHAADQQMSHVSGEYLKRSLDAFDELVTSLQTEVNRMTTERNDARRLAEEIEKRLTKEIAILRREIRSLRRVLNQNGITLPIELEKIE